MASPIQNRGQAAAKVCDCIPNHETVAAPTVALRTGATPAASTTKVRTSCRVSNRTGRLPVRFTSHAPATASSALPE